jgi:hypothetical protein
LYIKKYKWVRIISWKIKHKENIYIYIYIYIYIKKSMQNSWSKSWDQDKFIEKKLKIITKLIFTKNTNEEW